MRPLYYATGIVALLVIGSLAWVNNDADAPLLVLFLAFGALGAVVRENVDLRARTANSQKPAPAYIVVFSPVLGALLALILMSLFLSGLVTGDLFPKFLNSDQPFESARAVLRGGVTFASNSDFYKSIAWSTIAGYSERLVLSKLDAVTSPPSEKPPQGVK
jgi:hypothetical protein